MGGGGAPLSCLTGSQGFVNRCKYCAAGSGPSGPSAHGLRRYHPPIPSALVMSVDLKVADFTQRLANQLQTLSEVAETLTFRLLELEERLVAQELKVEPLLDGSASGFGVVAEDTELRLGETEDRLAQLEGLLSGPESTGAAHHLRSIAPAAVPAVAPMEEEAVMEEPPSEDPFLDDAEQAFADELLFAEEQPFLDELSA